MTTVLQLVDSLHLGGLERVAVDLANGLSERHRSLLCSTRVGGLLEQQLQPEVDYLLLGRTSRFDLAAVKRCCAWAANADVDIVHAHGSSILFANQLLLRWPRNRETPKLVWHDHFGRYATEERNRWVYRLLTYRAATVISVNEPLRQWAIDRLAVPEDRCIYLPNSVDLASFPISGQQHSQALTSDPVIVSVANFREQKNHKLLIEAFAQVARASNATLRLIGAVVEPHLVSELRHQIRDLGVEERVEFVGECTSVPTELMTASIGVLSSSSEGLPLALLEYGAAGLAVVSTDVGQIPQVLGFPSSDPAFASEQRSADPNPPAGLLVPSNDSAALAQALLKLATQPTLRSEMGSALRRRVHALYSRESTLERLEAIYQKVLSI